MQHLKPGELVALNQNGRYYVFLILSPSAFFGCQWALAFYKTHDSCPSADDIGIDHPEGFVALIEFIVPRRTNSIIRMAKGVDVSRFIAFDLVKALIRMPEQEALWHIYNRHNSEILRKVPALSGNELDYPIWSGVHASEATRLIESRWHPDILVSPSDTGQYPLVKDGG